MRSFNLIFLLGMFFSQCQNNAGTESAVQRSNTNQETGFIHLTTDQIANAGIETGTFSRRPLTSYIATTAELSIAKEHTATAGAFTDGIISELRIQSNQQVSRGAVVAIVRKPDLVDMQQQFLEARDRIKFLQTEFERYRELKNADATATKNFMKAEADLRVAQTTATALSTKLRQFQIDPNTLTIDNFKTDIAITAPIGGTISKIIANTGTAVTMGAPICEITDFSQLHPVLFIFEKDVASLAIGQSVQLYLPGQPDKQYEASVYQIERVIDPVSKTLRAHARINGPSPSHFTLGGYMEARISLSGKAGGSPALPVGAVVREGSIDYIFIQESVSSDGANFRKLPVRTGASDKAFVEVTPLITIPETAKIVIKGAYYISAQGAGISVEE